MLESPFLSIKYVLTALQITFTIVALLGFGFYLWHLKSNGDQSQSRLLNILHGYLSLICMEFSLILLYGPSPQDFKNNPVLFRIGAVHVIAVPTIFLLVSWATILNHFRPGLYLDISVSWSHRIAVSSLIFAIILTEQAANFSCPEKFLKCEMFRVRTIVMLPATLISFLCQLLVIIDDIFGWKNIYNRLRELCRQNLVSPVQPNNWNIEQQLYYDLPQAPNQPLVSFICC